MAAYCVMPAVPMEPPALRGLATAVAEAENCFDRVRTVRAGAHVNTEGGDISDHGHGGLMVRHVVHYLAAVEIAESLRLGGPMVDVGSGVGALAAWAAGRLGVRLHLVDHDPSVRSVASRAFPRAQMHASTRDLPPGKARLVTAMEVLEHMTHAEQPAFVRSLLGLLAPGGLLVVSTPDESRYAGGWSGYAPHIGPVTFSQLDGLLRPATDGPVAVWRLEGPGYRLRGVQRVLHPVANRAWGAVAARAPGLADRLVTAASALPSRSASVPDGQIRVTADEHGDGSGLLAAARRAD